MHKLKHDYDMMKRITKKTHEMESAIKGELYMGLNMEMLFRKTKTKVRM